MAQKIKNKAQSERAHFKRRLWERYGIRVNRFGYFDLLDQVKHKQSECLMIQSNTRTVHKVHIDATYLEGKQVPKIPYDETGVDLLVVYDKLRGELVTVLPYGVNVTDIEQYYNENG